MRYIIYPPDHQKIDQLGGKAGALAALNQTDAPIPAWFALSPAAFYDSLTEAQAAAWRAALQAGRPASLTGLTLSEAVQAELTEALAELSPAGQLVAVRSSAPEEDGTSHSFAGQLASFLNAPPAEVAQRVVEVWRSAFSERALAYRRRCGLTAPPQPPTGLIQRMVQAERAGVAFSADPLSGDRDVVLIEAVAGLGEALVSGAASGETYRVDLAGRVTFSPPPDESSRQEKITNNHQPITNSPALLDPAQAQAIAALARRVAQFFDRPQDIEWAIEADQLYLLQARPITTLPPASAPEGALNIWDNSNIAESYPGVTTPLTFSFARRAYEEVYRQFCRMMGVPAAKITANEETFKRMLGLRQGRIYYNLLSWHRVLALLPGYKLNRRFMEQMMGVKEGLPDELLDQQTTPGRGDRLLDLLHLLRGAAGLLFNLVWLPRRIEKFYARLDRALGQDRPDLSQESPEALVAYYRRLEQQLLTRWDAPLVNDFFAMIFYGLLRSLTTNWAGDRHGSLQNELLAHTGDVISAEPARRIRRLAQLSAASPDFVDCLRHGTLAQISVALPTQPAFQAEYDAYLAKFGERCLEELKLESPTLHDDPLPLLRAIGHLAQTGPDRPAPEETISHSPVTNDQSAPHPGLAALSLPRRLILSGVRNAARRLLRQRENLRFERTRLFGRARQIFVALGQRFHALDLLADPRDIFYLEAEEAFGLVNGTATTANLKALVALRRAEFERYRDLPPPPSRFETRGIPGGDYTSRVTRHASRPPKQETPELETDATSTVRQGQGCSPGRVRGRVRVVTEPKTAALQPGEILVAERTDPGWITLFAAAGGLLVEHGSLLSHAAIVSRELELPAVVALPGLTRWLHTGDWVEFDGRTGQVTRLERAAR